MRFTPTPELVSNDTGTRLHPEPARYRHKQQYIKHATEAWFAERVPCPDCGQRLARVMTDQPSKDLACIDGGCSASIELKARRFTRGRSRKVAGAAFEATATAFKAPPHLAWLRYVVDESGLPAQVASLYMTPTNLLHPDLIVPGTVRNINHGRRRYQGCTIDLGLLPQAALVPLVTLGVMRNFAGFQREWRARRALPRIRSITDWRLDVLHCIDIICADGRTRFSITDFRPFYFSLQDRHPGNGYVEAKVRQSLQDLRNRSLLEFEDGNGTYRRLN